MSPIPCVRSGVVVTPTHVVGYGWLQGQHASLNEGWPPPPVTVRVARLCSFVKQFNDMVQHFVTETVPLVDFAVAFLVKHADVMILVPEEAMQPDGILRHLLDPLYVPLAHDCETSCAAIESSKSCFRFRFRFRCRCRCRCVHCGDLDDCGNLSPVTGVACRVSPSRYLAAKKNVTYLAEELFVPLFVPYGWAWAPWPQYMPWAGPRLRQYGIDANAQVLGLPR